MTTNVESLNDFKSQVANILSKLTTFAVPEQYEAIKFMRNTLASVEASKALEVIPVQKTVKRNSRSRPKQRKVKNVEKSLRKRIITKPISFTKSFVDTIVLPVGDCNKFENDIKNRSGEKSQKHDYFSTVSIDDLQSVHSSDEVRGHSTKRKKKNAKSLKTLCVLCGKMSQNFSGLLQHLFDHQGSPKSCFHCKKSFNNAIGFEYHKVMRLCDQNITLEKVMQCDNTSVESSSLKLIIVCPFCSERFTKYYNLRRHLSRKCVSKTNVDEKGLRNDTKVHNFACKQCSESFYTLALLKNHLQTHKEPVEANHICVVCRCLFLTRKVLRLHMKKHSPEQIKIARKLSGDSSTVIPKKTPVKCDKCDVMFSTHFTYKRHYQRIHSAVPESFVVCEKCGKKLNGNFSLQEHVKKCHRELLSCDQCQYKSSNRNNLKRHKELLHQEVFNKKFSCEICSARFKLRTTFKEHLRTVHNENRYYTCYVCTATFKIQALLKRHLMTHEAPTLPCPHCPMMFRRTDHRDRHVTYRHKNIISMNGIKLKAAVKDVPSQHHNLEVNPPVMDQVFSLMDAQSGELVTLSVAEISSVGHGSAMINMSEGELLNANDIPVLWNNLSDAYTLDPLLPTVTSNDHYPHDQNDASAYPYLSTNHANISQQILLKSQHSPHVDGNNIVQHLNLDTRQITNLSDVLFDKRGIMSPAMNPGNVMAVEHIPIGMESPLDDNIAFIHNINHVIQTNQPL